MSIKYQAIITYDKEEGFFVQFPVINEAFTEAATLSEALSNAQEVLNLSLEGRLEDGMEIPLPDTEKSNGYFITPDASIQSALLIHFNRGKQSLKEVAGCLGVSIQELESPKNNLTLSNLEQIAHAIGKRLVLDFVA
jgi:antitoxin HicB